MSKAPSSAKRDRLKSFVPKLVDATENIIYGDMWERTQLSKRDRSLVTVASLVAQYRPEQLEVHVGRALDNGVTVEEIGEIITHLAFYAGWPAGMSAAHVALSAIEKKQAG